VSPEKQEVRKGPFARFIADGVRSGDVVTLSGQVSIDAKGAVVAPGDLVGQTRQVYGLIGGILSEFGATMENVVDEMWLVTDIADAMAKSREMFALRGEVYGERAAVSQTMVQVGGLVMPELLIEIKVIARV
jgi:enamine deaminase RidA (YjgF/YER057c/UK114 family)